MDCISRIIRLHPSKLRIVLPRCTMTKWIYLGGAPDCKTVLNDFEHYDDDQRIQINCEWIVLPKSDTRDTVDDSQRSIYEHDIFAVDSGINESLQGVQYRAAEHSKSVTKNFQTKAVDDQEGSCSAHIESQNTTDSFLPPPTQNRLDVHANQTTEQSILNVPNWSFALSALTPLNALPRVPNRRVNLLVYLHELEPPSIIPLKKLSMYSKKAEVCRAGMTVFDESGVSLQIVMWDDYAHKWAGCYLKEGDIVYLEHVLISEYKGEQQGSVGEGSRLQICYRSHPDDIRLDKQFMPDLELAWDPVSKQVKALKDFAV